MQPHLARARASKARRAVRLVISAVLVLASLVPIARADEYPATDSSGQSASRISAADPLNNGFLLLNMHGMLFHPEVSDIDEDIAYARWLGGGVIRVFATDSNGLQHWDGTQQRCDLRDALAPATDRRPGQ